MNLSRGDARHLLGLIALAPFLGHAAPLRFSFGADQAPAGTVAVRASDAYTPARGYGFEPGPVPAAVSGGPTEAVAGAAPFLFSVLLPEGDYQVDLILGNPRQASETTVRAEQRRLFFEAVRVGAGETAGRRLLVDVRRPEIAGGGQISRKGRELKFVNWDDKLTLEFDGPAPAVEAVTITPVAHPLTVYLAGDSTVTDQPFEPWCSWGQILPRFLDSAVAVSNLAESGETAASFIGEHRWQKLLSVAQPGDYVFLQFGHNDQKDHRAGAGAFTTYTQTLDGMVQEALAHGLHPVLLTSMNRRTFDAAGQVTGSLGDYPEAVRRIARARQLPLIDLNAATKVMYETWGPAAATQAFVHFPANTYPDQVKELKDDTHFRNYGAYEIARIVVEGIRASLPQLARHVAADAGSFDPAKPDAFASFHLAASSNSRALEVPAQAK